MVIFPNAKINIGLNILQKRADGYHDIETLFYPIGMKDALEYVENGGNELNFTCSGLNLDIEPELNMVIKAYRMLQDECTLPGLNIHLHKVIPSGAGLGGGSSDAAFFMKSLNDHLELNISGERLKSLARRLGADCPFFLDNKPAFATGTGDILSQADISLEGYFLLLIKPHFGVDTKTAYSGVVSKPFPYNFKEILCGEMNGWKEKIKNDFEPSLFLRFPELALLKNTLSEMSPAYLSMSGSGSSVYAIFERDQAVDPNDFSPGSFIWKEKLA